MGKHKAWMNGKTFIQRGKKYVITEGSWMVKNHEVIDSIKFHEVKEREDDEPPEFYHVPETEFFEKVNI